MHDGSGLMASTRRVAALTRHNLLLRRRDPSNLITYMITPMILIALFKPVLTRLIPDGTAQDVTGMLVLSSTLALQIAGMSLLSERTWRTWEMLRTTPASAAELLIGKAVPVLAVLLLQQAAVIGYSVTVVGLSVAGPPFLLLLLALLVWSMTLLAAGSLLATLVRSHSQLALLTDIGAIVLSTLAGALLPLSMMPSIARHLAPASPGYWAISMLKAAIRGDAAGTLGPAAVLTAIAVVAGTTACLRLRRGLAQLRS